MSCCSGRAVYNLVYVFRTERHVLLLGVVLFITCCLFQDRETCPAARGRAVYNLLYVFRTERHVLLLGAVLFITCCMFSGQRDMSCCSGPCCL